MKENTAKTMYGRLSIVQLLSIILLVIALCFWLPRKSSPSSKNFDKNILLTNKANSGSASSGSGMIRATHDGVEYLYQDPIVDPRALLFVAHGCHHSATDWWVKQTEKCPECLGLPEERAIVKLATEKYKMTVIAISSVDRQTKCWKKADGPRVAKVLKHIYSDNTGHYKDIPILTFGASSGGGFVASVLPAAMKEMGVPLVGYISQIMARPLLDSSENAVYITMDRDMVTDANAESIVETLKGNRVKALHIRLPPIPLSDSYFSDRIVDITEKQSTDLVKALKSANMLDTSSLLSEDPRKSNWRSVLANLEVHGDTLEADESPISEVLNVAWSMHEMSRDGVSQALDFLLKK